MDTRFTAYNALDVEAVLAFSRMTRFSTTPSIAKLDELLPWR